MARQTPYLAAGIALCGVLCFSPPAAAQLAPSGGSFLVASAYVRGTASAYDTRDNVFLVVGAHGALTGRLLKPDGSFAGNPFQIDPGTSFAQYPSVAYSPLADSGRGAFLVTWHQSIGAFGNLVHTQLVSVTGALLGGAVLLGSEPTWWESAPNIDYSPTSQLFMVTWRIGAYQIRGARVSLTGQNLDPGQGILVSSSGGERDPSVAYSPDNDAFLISYASFLGGVGTVYSRLVAASNGSLGPPQLLGTGTACYLTDATFSTGAHKFVVGWYQLPTGSTARLVNSDGTPIGSPIPLSSRFGTYDSFGVAYNPKTQSSLVVGQDLLSVENGGVEISEAGGVGSAVVLTNAGGPTGNFYPQVSASTAEGKWLVTTAHNFTSVVAQFATAVVARQAPAITKNPSSVSVPAGRPAIFTATASGSPAPTVQWETTSDGTTWVPIPGGTLTTLGFVAQFSQSHHLVRARFSNGVLPDKLSLAAMITVTTPATDFDADGRADAVVWNRNSGAWNWASSSGGANVAASGIQWGNASLGDISLSGDIDGDGLADLVIWRGSTGTWFWLTSSTGYSFAVVGSKQWGNLSLGDVPMLADFDGDGKADLCVWRASTGTWHWLTSTTGYSYAAAGVKQWGNIGLDDRPFAADMDGDGVADLAIWRAVSGTWFWLTSSSGYSYTASGIKQWGNMSLGDVPMVGDIDGDGRGDLIVWRASTGTWFWLNSSNGYSYTGSGAVQWGNQGLGDMPLLADFDGDGRADFLIFRPTTAGGATWYWLNSSQGYATAGSRQFGSQGDIPIVK